MPKPIVAIVGRPNVGKSTLFNKITGRRIAIVEDTPGVTRDRIYSEAEWLNNKFTLIDTGGIEPESEDIILKQMKRQAETAIETSDVIIFIVDGKDGVTPADNEVANILRKAKKPVLLAVNKVDNISQDAVKYEFYNLGMGDPIAISASESLGIGDLLDEIVKNFKQYETEEEEIPEIKVALIGKPNVGKSSLLNKFTGEERSIVSNIPGTTRDAIDSFVKVGEDKFLFIDTAGIRRKSKTKEDIERYSVIRTLSAIERADVCVVMLDADQGIAEQDEKIAGLAHEAYKAVILAVNKWDMVDKDERTMNEFTNVIRKQLSFLSYAPVIFISAKTGQRTNKLAELIKHVNAESKHEVKTGALNEVISEALMMKQPPIDKGKALKIYYATQVSIQPPTFVFFVNYADTVHYSYERYLENQLRQHFGFEGTPIKLIFRPKNDEKNK